MPQEKGTSEEKINMTNWIFWEVMDGTENDRIATMSQYDIKPEG